jgi:rod shape-determining protein MreD
LFRNNEPTGVRVNTRTGPGGVQFAGPEWWIPALYLVVALLVQSEVLHYFTLRGAQLSIVLVIVVWYGLRTDLLRAAIFGLIAGACEDALGTQTGASWMIATTCTALFASALSRWFFADSIPVTAGVVFAATLLQRLIFWIAMSVWVGYPPGYARVHFHQALWEALLNAIFVIVATVVARRFEDRRLDERRAR